MRRVRKVIFAIAVIVLSGAILYSGYMLWGEYQDYKKEQAMDDAMREYMPQNPGYLTAEERIRLLELQKMNPDVVGWVMIEDSNVNYPVLRGEDNTYYLDHAPTKEYLAAGSIFMDCRNAAEFTDPKTILYGHNMKNRSMFAHLVRFEDKPYFDSHTTGWLYTPDIVYRLDLFAYISTPKYDEEMYDLAFPKEETAQHFNKLLEKARFQRDVALGANDRVLVLSTCAYNYADERAIVLGKLVQVDQVQP